MGAFALQSLGLDVSLDLHHGIPLDTAWGIPAFPMYHPALGMYEPKKMLQIRTDWHRLRSFLQGRQSVPVDDIETDYQEVTDVRQLALEPDLPIACDTESDRSRSPFCFTYSQRAGEGRLVRAGNRGVLAALSSRLERWAAPVLFHNFLYDWGVCGDMGLQLPIRRVVDTMARVFHLGNLPQGLKALAFRELGMVMQDFEDVVRPHSTPLVLDYYRRAQEIEWPKPEEQSYLDEKTGLWKLKRPQGMNTKLKRFFTDYGKNPDKDVFAMWHDNWGDSHAMLEHQLGEWPGMCISHVPFEEVLYYACRDADALIRLWPLLRRMNSQVRHYSQEHWRR